jgi:hypothetical protein
MKITFAALVCSLCLPAVSLRAQNQIGGGICSSASLTGTYSLTLTGRDVSSTVTFSKVSQAIGSATFDGLNKVTFSLTDNTNQSFGVPQALAGTYSLQANCVGALSLTTGDTATFALESYNQGKAFLLTGQDGTYAFMGSGNLLPATCSASVLSGVYSFNGTGFGLTSGTVSAVNDISGLLTFDGKSAVTSTWFVATAGPATTDTLSGTYSVAPSCAGSATLTDAAGNAYTLTLTLTATNGDFIVSGSNPLLMFTGTGRVI